MATLAWRKSSYSENGANCVEVTPAAAGILLRDTKDRGAGPVITFTPVQWTMFLAEVASDGASANGAAAVSRDHGGVEVHAAASGIRLRFTPSEWAAFLSGVQDGEFDLLTHV